MFFSDVIQYEAGKIIFKWKRVLIKATQKKRSKKNETICYHIIISYRDRIISYVRDLRYEIYSECK